MAASTRGNGLVAKHTGTVQKPDPMGRYGTMASGKTIDLFNTLGATRIDDD